MSANKNSMDMIGALSMTKCIWVVGAIHGDINGLHAIHSQLLDKIDMGDQIVYCGNMIGYQPNSMAVIEELLAFRCWFLSRPSFVRQDDIVFLHGHQEEMLMKLLIISHAEDELLRAIEYMRPRGLVAMIDGFGGDGVGLLRATDQGFEAISQWAVQFRTSFKQHSSHTTPLFTNLRPAVIGVRDRMLIVSAGLSPDIDAHDQSDLFWWDVLGLQAMQAPYRQFDRVISGYSAGPFGLQDDGYKVCIDGGAGCGGNLLAVAFDRDANIIDRISS